jgi:3-oxoadipate enol-lactonase
MPRVISGDAEIAYQTLGSGSPIVLLHPFPANHEFWLPIAERLATHYQLILPDLRGHGDSEIGEGPATMDKHAADVAKVCDDAGVERGIFAGVSIGGYTLFEFWRKFRERVSALILCNTKAQADTAEARAARLKSAEDVLKGGPEQFIESMIPKLIGATTRETRPDLVERARNMMKKMSAEDISQVQQGMAVRADSVATLKTINVPTLVVAGDEDGLTPVADAELMRQNLAKCELRVLNHAGHYGVFEQNKAAATVMQEFLGSLRIGKA